MINKITKFLENNLYSKIFQRHEVDFSMPWFTTLIPYKYGFIFGWMLALFERGLEASLPFLVAGYFIGSVSLEVFVLVIIASLLISPLGFNLIFRIERQVFGDIDFGVNKKILEIDPIFHTIKSSSLLTGKLKKGLGQLAVLIFAIAIDIPTKTIFLISSLISLFFIDVWIFLIAFASVGFTIFINFWFRDNIIKKYKLKSIQTDDKYVETLFENISQAQLIRNSFATKERMDQFKSDYKESLADNINSNLAFSFGFVTTKILLFIPIPFISQMLYNQVQSGDLNTSIAIATITSLIFGLVQINGLGGQILKLYEAHKDVESTFMFIDKVGTKSFPVLKSEINEN